MSKLLRAKASRVATRTVAISSGAALLAGCSFGGLNSLDMMSQGQNTENLKLLFRDTNASAEAVINGAALEKYDDTAKRADVLVAVRVTVTDLDGNNAPSKPYRLRVSVQQGDNGQMTFYDLKYPDGGN